MPEVEYLLIEDDDGFATRWPWPADKSILGNGAFADLCGLQHDELRALWIAEKEELEES